MKIDHISTSMVRLALSLNQQKPGLVSEIWLDRNVIARLKSDLPQKDEVDELIKETRNKLTQNKTRRNQYLSDILTSLEFQISHNSDQVHYSEFSQKTYGFKIQRVTKNEIKSIEDSIKKLEQKLKLTRLEVYKKHLIREKEIKAQFQVYVKQAKDFISGDLLKFPDKGFEIETVRKKPWSAYNYHTNPYKSKLSLNLDSGLTKLDLYRLAFHEGYCGHHTELSTKDKLLMQQGLGEHGLVITFSPQVFVSEAIAEGMYIILGGLDRTNKERLLAWYYDRLTFALYNLATFMYFDDKLKKPKIVDELSQYSVSNKTITGITNFSTDSIFGRYAPVYYSAFNFLNDLYKKTNDKDKLIKTLFTKPCTPSLLVSEFSD